MLGGIFMKLKPLFDRVVLKPIKEDQNSQGGIILAETSAERPSQAIVVAVGSGIDAEGKHQEMQVKNGDHVLYSKYGGINFKENGQEYIILRQNDILGVWQ